MVEDSSGKGGGEQDRGRSLQVDTPVLVTHTLGEVLLDQLRLRAVEDE